LWGKEKKKTTTTKKRIIKVETNWVPMAFPYAFTVHVIKTKPRRIGKLACLPRRRERTRSEPLVKLSAALPVRTNAILDAYKHETEAQKIEQSTLRE